MSEDVKPRAVGVYTHRHGTDVCIYANKEEALLGLSLAVLDNINSGDVDGRLSLEAQREIVQAYKEGDYQGVLDTYNLESEDETMTVVLCYDDGPPTPATTDFLEQIDRVLEQKQKEEDDEYEAEQPSQGDQP